MEELKSFIKSRSAFNYRELSRLIEWHPSSFHSWINDKRPIPKEKANNLIEVLKKYGYNKYDNQSIQNLKIELKGRVK